MSQKSIRYERLERELKKCIVLCANCHREVHAGLIDLTDYGVEGIVTDTPIVKQYSLFGYH